MLSHRDYAGPAPSRVVRYRLTHENRTMSKDTKTAHEPAILTLYRLPEVRARCALSRSEIYRRIAIGEFPKPIKLGERASAWAAHEVAAWIAARIAARDGQGTP